jgi:hypothetical protein
VVRATGDTAVGQLAEKQLPGDTSFMTVGVRQDVDTVVVELQRVLDRVAAEH